MVLYLASFSLVSLLVTKLKRKKKLATNMNRTKFLFVLFFYFFFPQSAQGKCIIGLVTVGNQMFSQLHWKIRQSFSFILFHPSVLRLAIPSHIFSQLLCMLCLRISSPSCSQAGKTPQPVKFSHVIFAHILRNSNNIVDTAFWMVNVWLFFCSKVIKHFQNLKRESRLWSALKPASPFFFFCTIFDIILFLKQTFNAKL